MGETRTAKMMMSAVLFETRKLQATTPMKPSCSREEAVSARGCSARECADRTSVMLPCIVHSFPMYIRPLIAHAKLTSALRERPSQPKPQSEPRSKGGSSRHVRDEVVAEKEDQIYADFRARIVSNWRRSNIDQTEKPGWNDWNALSVARNLRTACRRRACASLDVRA